MIRRLIFLSCLVCCCLYTQAQDTEPKERKNEVGYDVLPLFAYVFGGNASGIKTFDYRRHLGKWTLRSRIGGFFRKNTDDNDSTFNYSDNYNFMITLGLERNNVIKDWFEVHYGFEFTNRLLGYANITESTDNDFYRYDDNRSDVTSVGLAFFLGVGIRINERLRLITETRHETKYTFGETLQISTYQSPLNYNYSEQRLDVEEWDVSYFLPNFLVLSFSF